MSKDKNHNAHNMCSDCNECISCGDCKCSKNTKTAEADKLRKMMIIVSKSGIDSVYAAMILANGARSEGIECDMFFTFFGLDAITKKRMNNIKIAIAGNTGMHMPAPVGAIPGMDSFATSMMKKKMHDLDIPDVPEFLEMINAAGGKVFGCKLAMDMFGLKREDLWDDVDGVLTVGEFYERFRPGTQIIFI